MNLTLYFALEQYIPINTHFSGLSPFGVVGNCRVSESGANPCPLTPDP